MATPIIEANADGLDKNTAAASKSEDNQVINSAAAQMIKTLTTSSDASARATAAKGLADFVKVEGANSFTSGTLDLDGTIKKGLQDKKNQNAREGACNLIYALHSEGVGAASEPFLMTQIVPIVLSETFGDKVVSVRNAAVEAMKALLSTMSPYAVKIVLPTLAEQIRTNGKWQAKVACLSLLDVLVKHAPQQLAASLPDIMPVLAEVVWDTKADVKKAARIQMDRVCTLCSNKDIERFIPALISALINPIEEVQPCIQLLASTTFVSAVDAPTLALMVPLLSRGLNERPTPVKRKTGVIIDNMSKLVDDPELVRPFIPKLLPDMLKVVEVIADPEARGVMQRAIKTLRSVANLPEDSDGSNLPAPKTANVKVVGKSLDEILKTKAQTVKSTSSSPLLQYVCALAANIVDMRNFDNVEWESSLSPYMLPVMSQEDARNVCNEWVQKLAILTDETVEEEDEEGEDLCNCQFSLAYGAKILLNQATLRLKKGRRYGLCGRNGSGKSTLMRAISNEQVEGFPSRDELKTVYVEHDIDADETDKTILNYIIEDPQFSGSDRKEVIETLESVGFDVPRQQASISSLSGGWKMKLALAKAMLTKSQIFLLDEPTNHLDVVNVKWLEDYLCSLTTVTCIIVSHDSGFLDTICTDILHLDRFKLRRYHGNLSTFVKKVPEAKTYYQLGALDDYKFKIPAPTLLDGVKTKEKAIMKARHVGYQYPNTTAPQIYDATFQVSLSSRVALLGPNGSGKSTLVKLLIGDTEPDKGEVWRHPNLVIGYVAQHAFHHIDQRLDSTPSEYLQWRFATGEDIEELSKTYKQVSAAEKAQMEQPILFEGTKRIVEEITGRRKLKQSFEYEIQWKGMSTADRTWMSRTDLLNNGFEKKVAERDSYEAARSGMLRPLVRKEIEAHFQELGLEAEFVTHNTMRGLSGGQKVKVVLAAATWRRPHILVLDEPTNYLDRESLGALVDALKSFEGGVVIVTHHRDFSEAVCSEVWAMDGGRLRPSGHNWVEGQGAGPRIDTKQDEEDKFDAMGNKIVQEKKKLKLTSAELRKKKKDRMARRKRGEEVFSDEDEL